MRKDFTAEHAEDAERKTERSKKKGSGKKDREVTEEAERAEEMQIL